MGRKGCRKHLAGLLATVLLTALAPTAVAAPNGGSTAPGKHPQPKTVSLAAVGDTMLGNTPQLPSDPAGYLAPMRKQLTGDVVFGNLEGTLTGASYSTKCGGPSGGDCFAFRAPPRFGRALATAGFTVMNNANNHFGDFGGAGEADTAAALSRAGIARTGSPGKIALVKAAGTKLAFVGFSPYANANSLLDLGAARALIRRAAKRAPIVVVAIHAGAEGSDRTHVTGHEEHYLGEDRGNPERFAHMAVRAGADLVLGSGPHVLRGMEIYRGRLLAYSLGNFCGFHNFATSGVLGSSAVLHVQLGPEGALKSGRLASVRLDGAGRPLPDPSGAARDLVAHLSRADFGADGVRLGKRGKILDTASHKH
jgi:poly-gamma-glutamate capsule biosynthesis protein CapA/YwtB (metallophosphatase superfamily)